MDILSTGIDINTGATVSEIISDEQFGQQLARSLGAYIDRLQSGSTTTQAAANFRGEVERERTPDLGDPHAVGWTFLINPRMTGVKEYIEVVRPLAEMRKMADPAAPLEFHGESEEEWETWLGENYASPDGKSAPHYILIIGGPENVPFGFQSMLNNAASVGRLDFDTPNELKAYVDKLIRIRKADEPLVEPSSVFFAPVQGFKDPTYFSFKHLARPLAAYVRDTYFFDVTEVFNQKATKSAFTTAFEKSRPALVFTASHGAVAPSENLNVQKKVYGALCCLPDQAGDPANDWIFSADDVPDDRPFLEGSVFFQFACFGYGNPAKSDFEVWLNRPQQNAPADFVSALPKKMLAHPHGPLAYIGHIDTAWMHGFIEDPDRPDVEAGWRPRLEPYTAAISSLLEVQPVGRAMANMYRRFERMNNQIVNSYIQVRRGDRVNDAEYQKWLAGIYITRSDAQNYMVLGDPAISLRIPSG